MFSSEEINSFSVDENDEWQYPYYEDKANVKIWVGGDVEKRVCNFFGIKYEDVIYNGWIDSYVFVNVKEKRIDSILFVVTPNNDEICEEQELEIEIRSIVEGEKIYKQLANNESFVSFVKDSEQYLEERR